MLKQSIATVVSTFGEETSNKQVILVDVDLPLVNNLQTVHGQQEKPGSDTEIDNEPEVSGGVQYYILVCDREHHSTKPPERYEYEDLVAYALLTSFGDPSTF